MVYRAGRIPFVVDTCGWEVEIHDLGIALLPPTGDPDHPDEALQFFSYRTDPEGARSDTLLESLQERIREHARNPAVNSLEAVTCGVFSGWYGEFVARDGAYWRFWKLGHGDVGLHVAFSPSGVAYSPAVLAADRLWHREAVDRILASLSEG